MHTTIPQYPSIDTVELGFRVDPEALAAFLPLSSHFAVCRPDGALTRDSSRFYLWDGSRQVESWWNPPICRLVGEYLRVQVSIPKIYFGHNAGHVYAQKLVDVAAGLYDLLCQWSVPLVCAPHEILLNRVDISYNFELPSEFEAAQLYKGLTFCRYRGKNPLMKRGKSYAYWPGETRTIKFYLKGPEIDKHCDRPGFSSQVHPELNTFLRYEEEWRLPTIKRFCTLNGEKLYQSDVTVFTFIRACSKKWNTQAFLDQINKNFVSRIAVDPGRSLQYISLAVRRGELRPSTADKLYRFFSFTAESGRVASKNHFGVRPYYRYCSKIRQLTGIDLDSEELNRGSNYINSENLKKLNFSQVSARFDSDFFMLNPYFAELNKCIRAGRVKDQVIPPAYYQMIANS